MPKKVKQKQSQKTSVVVNVGTLEEKRPSKSRAKKARLSGPSPFGPSPFGPRGGGGGNYNFSYPQRPQPTSLTLQGSNLALPYPPSNDYNAMIQHMEYLRRQQAQSGSLISNVGRNELLNRVEANNPLLERATNTQNNLLKDITPHGDNDSVAENEVDALMGQSAFIDQNYTLETPIDQDFLFQRELKQKAPNLKRTGLPEDVETTEDLIGYDDDEQRRLSKEIERQDTLRKLNSKLSGDTYKAKPHIRLEKEWEHYLKTQKEKEKERDEINRVIMLGKTMKQRKEEKRKINTLNREKNRKPVEFEIVDEF